MLLSNKGKPVDLLGVVDEFVDIEFADGPLAIEGQATIEHRYDSYIVFTQIFMFTSFKNRFPGFAPANDIQIVRGLDNSPHDQRATAEYRLISSRKIQAFDTIE